ALDDAAQDITDIVRGRDLFYATAVHRLLQALLGLPQPRYHHHKLLLGPDGSKLSKSTQSTGLRELRARGASPTEIRRLAGLDRTVLPCHARAGEGTMARRKRKRPARRARASSASGTGLGKARIQAVEAALAGIAHDIRTPLTGIVALAELLASSDLGAREREWANAIKSGANH